jgi:predicted peptidase
LAEEDWQVRFFVVNLSIDEVNLPVMKKLLAIIGIICCCQSLSAQDFSAFKKKVFVRNGDTLPYRILYPQKYKKRKAYPVIVFLHGSGERGKDNELQLLHGGNLFLKKNIRKYFPAIVIFPQCPKDSTWARYHRHLKTRELTFLPDPSPTVPQTLVKELIDSLVDNGKVDTRRIYLGGLSLGGFGTYDMLSRYPDYFAAAFPICGAMDIPRFLERARNVPLWIFHGALDETVSPMYDRELYAALMTRGVTTVTYTEYPKDGHNSWDDAFAEPRLLPWLFSNKKRKEK